MKYNAIVGLALLNILFFIVSVPSTLKLILFVIVSLTIIALISKDAPILRPLVTDAAPHREGTVPETYVESR
ncbi:MAG TPA: hypothetical protein PLF31_01330 [Candidatus Paceibacterota bacterium]|nr:hypothetical protein [Candidatus Paceibacterota bacterium]